MRKTTLVAGQLYQVKHWENGWIIAEYLREVPAHSYRYVNLDMMTCKTGREQVRHVPLSHSWRKVGYGSSFSTTDQKTETRPVTEETLALIASLKAGIARLEQEQQDKRKELRALCN